MKSRQTLQYAVMCLQELDQHIAQFMSSHEISKRQGIPQAVCEAVLTCLAQAGIIESSEVNQYRLCVPAEEVKVLALLEALSAPVPDQPVFKVLYAAQKTARRHTLEIVRWAQGLAVFPSDGGPARA